MTEKHIVERKGWKPGPWDDEPDLLRWNASGFACALVRNFMGAWCGYVGVPRSHRDHGCEYGDMPEHISAHGGLTFAGEATPAIKEACNLREHEFVPEDTWWFGYDCSHGGMDSFPGEPEFLSESFSGSLYYFYKTIAWAKAETERLAAQLAERGSHLRVVH